MNEPEGGFVAIDDIVYSHSAGGDCSTSGTTSTGGRTTTTHFTSRIPNTTTDDSNARSVATGGSDDDSCARLTCPFNSRRAHCAHAHTVRRRGLLLVQSTRRQRAKHRAYSWLEDHRRQRQPRQPTHRRQVRLESIKRHTLHFHISTIHYLQMAYLQSSASRRRGVIVSMKISDIRSKVNRCRSVNNATCTSVDSFHWTASI